MLSHPEPFSHVASSRFNDSIPCNNKKAINWIYIQMHGSEYRVPTSELLAYQNGNSGLHGIAFSYLNMHKDGQLFIFFYFYCHKPALGILLNGLPPKLQHILE